MDDQSCPWMPACLTAALRQRISGLPQDEQRLMMAFQAAFSAIAFEIQAVFNTDRDCGRIRYALGCQTLADLSLALNIQFEPLNPQVIVDALNSRAHTHGIRCLLLVSLMPVLPEPLLANGMVIAGELSDIFQELRQFEVTIRFLQALLKKTDGLQPDLNSLFPVLIRLCRYGRQNLQSAQTLTIFMQATGLRLTDLEQMEDHRTACRFVENCFSGLTQENLVDLLTALANCLIDTGGATLATKLLLAAIGLNPKDLYGLHSSEGNMGLLYEAHRQSPAQFVTELIKNHFKGNPPLVARQLGSQNLPGDNQKLLPQLFRAMVGDFRRLTSPKLLLDADQLPDQKRIQYSFAVARSLQFSGRPLPALSVAAGSLSVRDKSSVVPEHLRGAPEHVLFSEALRHIWPDDVHSRLQYGLYLTSMLQSQYGHQRALQLLLVMLEIPKREKCSLTVDQIQQCLTTLSRLAPALLLETTLQLYQALFASLQRGSATRLLEQFFRLAEQNGWQFTPLDQDRVTQLQMLHSNRRRVASFTALITTRFSTAAGLQNRNSVSTAIYRRGQPLSNSLLFEAAADLLIHARRIWQRAGINWVCPSPSVLTSSQLCAAWDTVLPAAIPELSLMASLWDQAEIVHSVTLAAELLLQADRPLDALQITDLLKNQDISPLAGGRITTAEHFAFVFSAAMAENSLIPILRFARVHATAVSRTKPTVNGAELLESFLSSSQSLREYPATWWLRELQPPERILHVTTWIRLAPARDTMRLSICRRLIQEIQQLSEEALHNTADRTSFWRQLQDTRVVIVNACLEHLDNLPAQAATEREKLYIELTIWLEILDNRVLYETVILQKAFEPQRADTKSHRYPEQADSTRPINESLSGQWEFILQSDDKQLQSWLSDLRQCMLSAQKLSTAITTFDGDAGEDPAFQQATDRLPDPEHLLDQDQLQPEAWKLLLAKICDVPDLHQLLPVNSLLIRATFDSAGRLHWWALHHTGNGSIRLAGCHISEAGAREVIAAASEAADAQIAAVWIRLQQLSRQQTDIHGQSPAASQSQSDWDWLVTKLDQLQIPVEELHHERWTRCKRSWPRLTALLTAPVVTDVTYKPAQPDLKPQVRQEIWEKCRKILASSPPCDLWAAWKDETLNSICSVQQRICSWFFDLTPLKLRPQELAGCSILTASEGPLLPVPVTWLPFHGAPLFTHCHSATATISLLLHRQKQSHTEPVMRQQPATLCTLWEQPKKRRSMGIPLFYRGLQALLQSRSQTQAVRLQTLCDTPIATPDNLAACTIGQAFDLLVVAGHGVAARQGIQLAGAAGGKSSQIWSGSGDFQHCGLIVLMACSMGRLHQYNHTEVDGLYASIVAHGGRSVIAPRWDVDDVMSATFLLDFLYLLPADFRELQQQPIGPVFNAARKKAWQSWVDSMSTQQAAEICCHHTLAAYEFFGW